jgi:hypothetical protein
MKIWETLPGRGEGRHGMIRNAYIRKAEERIGRLVEEVDSLRKRAETATKEAQSVLGREFEGIRGKAETVRKRIRDVRVAEAADWGRLKKGVEESIGDLKQAVDAAVQRFRKTGSDNR